MSDSLEKSGQAGTQITPSDQEAFRLLFQEWRDSYPTSDQLDAGGTGDLDLLARQVLRWADSLDI